MWPIVTDRVAWSVGRSVCRSVTLVSPAKTDKPTEMPFGLRTRVGPRNHPPCNVAILVGDGAAHCKVQGHSAVSCAETAEPIEMPFGLRIRAK